MLKKEIENRIVELGGTCDFQGKSLHDDLMSISFEKSFLDKDFWDGVTDESYKKIEEVGFVSESELKVYPRIEIDPFLYTPFKEGTDDYDDYEEVDNADYAKSIIGEDIQEFIVIGNSDAERWIVCLADKDPDNPTVYKIDMDSPFNKRTRIVVIGTLEDYFNNFLSADEYQKAMEEYVEELRSK